VERNAVGIDEDLGIFETEIGQRRRQAREEAGERTYGGHDSDGAESRRRPRKRRCVSN
jgi:hypothetical protein